MLAWAAVEESRLAAPARALALYHRRARARSRRRRGDGSHRADRARGGRRGRGDGRAHRGSSRDAIGEGAARIAIDLEIATVLLDRGLHPADALRSVAAVLESTPNDAHRPGPERAPPRRATESRAPAVAMLERTLESGRRPRGARADPRSPCSIRRTDAASRDLRLGMVRAAARPAPGPRRSRSGARYERPRGRGAPDDRLSLGARRVARARAAEAGRGQAALYSEGPRLAAFEERKRSPSGSARSRSTKSGSRTRSG